MGCKSSRPESSAPAPAVEKDSRREKQAEKRRASQDKLRPEDIEKQQQLSSHFENELNNWPHRIPWFLKGKHTQGINILIADPEPLRGSYHTLVVRNETKYTIDIGYGNETGFHANSMRFAIACSTVSSNHARFIFTRTNGQSMVQIEDCDSLNGTFILARPDPTSTRRPTLEKEVRKVPVTLEGVEYIRLGSACVLALEATNIFWDDDDQDEEKMKEVTVSPTEDLVPGLLKDGWYFPMPCPPKLAEITQKKRDEPEEAKKSSKNAASV
eukprot:c11724_g1_i1.p1 GENE.c11724_g1_i1~~c11724_g1_i1.p1  ORF type:complete len:270 (+),score=139.30 c11724_g1_i1:56-865(+)